MRRRITSFAALLVLCLAGAALCTPSVAPPTPIPHPVSPPRAYAPAVWANGKVYYTAGMWAADAVDGIGDHGTNNRSAGMDIYWPGHPTWGNSGTGWDSSKWDGTGPMGMDYDGNGAATTGEGVGYCEHQAFAYDNDGDGIEEIYVYGGYPNWGQYIYRYNPATNKWDRNLAAAVAGGPQEFGVDVVYNGTMYSYGGFGGVNRTFAKCDLTTGTLTMLPDGPVGCYYSEAAVVNGVVYLVGGFADGNSGNPITADIWSCDLKQDPPVWSSGPVGELEAAVRNAPACAYNGKIYVSAAGAPRLG